MGIESVQTLSLPLFKYYGITISVFTILLTLSIIFAALSLVTRFRAFFGEFVRFHAASVLICILLCSISISNLFSFGLDNLPGTPGLVFFFSFNAILLIHSVVYLPRIIPLPFSASLDPFDIPYASATTAKSSANTTDPLNDDLLTSPPPYWLSLSPLLSSVTLFDSMESSPYLTPLLLSSFEVTPKNFQIIDLKRIESAPIWKVYTEASDPNPAPPLETEGMLPVYFHDNEWIRSSLHLTDAEDVLFCHSFPHLVQVSIAMGMPTNEDDWVVLSDSFQFGLSDVPSDHEGKRYAFVVRVHKPRLYIQDKHRFLAPRDACYPEMVIIYRIGKNSWAPQMAGDDSHSEEEAIESGGETEALELHSGGKMRDDTEGGESEGSKIYEDLDDEFVMIDERRLSQSVISRGSGNSMDYFDVFPPPPPPENRCFECCYRSRCCCCRVC